MKLVYWSSAKSWTGICLLHRNNAGMYSQNLEFSEDKIEMTFATNYLGTSPFSPISCRFHLFLADLNFVLFLKL